MTFLLVSVIKFPRGKSVINYDSGDFIRKWVLWILFYNIKFKSIYLPKCLRYRVPIFNTTYHTITIVEYCQHSYHF